MSVYDEHLNIIEAEHQKMLDTLISWSEINSHSRNLDGLAKMLSHIKSSYQELSEELDLNLVIEEISLKAEKSLDSKAKLIELELGRALSIKKISQTASYNVFLGGHMDTVFPKDSSFQETKFLDSKTLNGPGVADLKGGLLVMLNTLRAFEKSPWADEINWEIMINPDEEIGSPGSRELFPAIAKRNNIGLVFEPSLPDGSLAYRRKGAGNFIAVAKGKAAHVGRAFDEGRSAMLAIAQVIQKIHELNSKHKNIIVNTGSIQGGGPSNVVADLALAHINVRIEESSDKDIVNEEFKNIAKEISEDGIEVEFHGGFSRAPKIPDAKTEKLYQALVDCGKDLNIEINKRNTGGCCDGNNLFEAGLANIDTLGVRGANIHSDQEYMLVDSLVERSKLSALLLMKLANKEINI